ncbi:MAG: hypothetical protein RLN88_04225 [Ekhidna sp.]|uniref:hypothetical protein n=1 Tax=Ekhidna sp. TaxID=2608089 RepID=UPI0032F06338
METLIVKENGNESVKANLRFKVIRSTVSKHRRDQFTYDSYSKAVDRMEGLKKIFKAKEWRWEIVIVEA